MGSLNLSRCANVNISNNTFSGTGEKLTIHLPTGRTKGRNWVIDNNTVTSISGATFNGVNYYIFLAMYPQFRVGLIYQP